MTDTTNRDHVSILREALSELVDIVQGVLDDECKTLAGRIDSFTLQPAHGALEATESAAIQPAGDAVPRAWMRKWAFDGEKPSKSKNKNNRLSWGKYKFLPVSEAQCLKDDVPLFAAPPAQASKDAEAGELPPLPKCKMLSGPALDSLHVLYTANQMQAYARAALARQSAPSSAVSEETAMELEMYRTVYGPTLPADWPDKHADDIAIDRTAAAMKVEMARQRVKGRGGWDDPAQCDVDSLADLLVESLSSGSMIGTCNYAMMLHQRGADLSITMPALARHVMQSRRATAPTTATSSKENK